MQPTTVTAMDNMEQLGLIERRRNTGDRRKINIFLTEKGWALKSELQPYASEVNAVALESLSEGELKSLWDMLKRINASLDEDHAKYAGRASGGRVPTVRAPAGRAVAR